MDSDKMIDIGKPCCFCSNRTVVTVDRRDYERYMKGGVCVQDAFPYLDASVREVLITGMCRKCQDDVFGGEEDE